MLKSVLVSLIFGLFIFYLGYFYLNNLYKENLIVSENEESVPYVMEKPDNCGILFNICEDTIILYLDFQNEKLDGVMFDAEKKDNVDLLGYKVDYTISTEYDLIGYFVDIIGGIELVVDGKTFRYTGIQVTEMLEYSNINPKTKSQIFSQIVKGISDVGFTKENLLYIIDNSDTDIKFNEGFIWVDYIQNLSKYFRIIDLRKE